MSSQMSKSAPRTCNMCEAKLQKPQYLPKGAIYGRWKAICLTCNTEYVWSHPHVWLERHPLPLFDRKIILEQKFDFYGKRLSNV